ncbi:MAG: hypothetical protein Q9220_004469 [cf. Caloplaca sp. 1 TL-2023]
MFPNVILLLAALAISTYAAPAPPEAIGITPPPVGDSQSDDDPCEQYSACGTKGKKTWDTLMKTVQNPVAMDRTDGSTIYNEFYITVPVDRADSGQGVNQDLLDHGLSPLDQYINLACVARQSSNGPEDEEETPYLNLFNKRDGVIIAVSNYRQEDIQKKLPWSELMFQAYTESLGPGESISALQAVVRTDVINPGTYNVARSAYTSIGLDMNTDTEWRRWTLAEQPYLFYGFLGTDNVKGVAFLLTDHSVAVGRKVITEIWTRSDNVFDIWITIGPYVQQ